MTISRYVMLLCVIMFYNCNNKYQAGRTYRIFARIRHTFFGQNWRVRLICELDLKLYFAIIFAIFLNSEIQLNLSSRINIS